MNNNIGSNAGSNASNNIDDIVKQNQKEFIEHLKGIELRSNEIIEQETEELSKQRLNNCTIFFLSASCVIVILWLLFYSNK